MGKKGHLKARSGHNGPTRTFLQPTNPSDSVKKYAKGMRKTRERLEKRKTRFHKPDGGTTVEESKIIPLICIL